jgi:hypothetical protein
MTSKVKKRGEITGKLNLAKRVEAPLSEDERPCFSFRYLSMDVSVKKCDNKVFKKFVSRLKLLSEMTWKQINASDRHSYGWELLSKDSLKPKKSIPTALSDIDKFHVFRYDSDNHAFVSVVKGVTVYPIFIEAKFGDVYDHQ